MVTHVPPLLPWKGIRLICGSCVADASERVLGLPRPWSQTPAFSPLIPEERWNTSRSWVSGFFVHRDIHSGDFNDLEVPIHVQTSQGSLVGVQDEVIAELTSMQMYTTHDGALVSINPGVLRYFTRCALFDKIMRCTTFLVQKSDLYMVPSRQVFVCTPYTNCGEGERFEGRVWREETTLYFFDEPKWSLAQFRACVESRDMTVVPGRRMLI